MSYRALFSIVDIFSVSLIKLFYLCRIVFRIRAPVPADTTCSITCRAWSPTGWMPWRGSCCVDRVTPCASPARATASTATDASTSRRTTNACGTAPCVLSIPFFKLLQFFSFFFLREHFPVITFLRGNFVRSRSFPCSDWPLASSSYGVILARAEDIGRSSSAVVARSLRVRAFVFDVTGDRTYCCVLLITSGKSLSEFCLKSAMEPVEKIFQTMEA